MTRNDPKTLHVFGTVRYILRGTQVSNLPEYGLYYQIGYPGTRIVVLATAAKRGPKLTGGWSAPWYDIQVPQGCV